MIDEEFPKSSLGFGTGSLMGRRGSRESGALLGVALENGIRHFDTARMYGRGEAEALLGRVVGSRDDVSIATKVGKGPATRSAVKARGYAAARPVVKALDSVRRRPVQGEGPPPPGRPGNFDPEYLRASIETSRRLLRRPTLDCVLLHEVTVADVTGRLEEMLQDMVASGRVRRFGIATDPDRLGALAHSGRLIGSVIQQPGGPFHDVVPIAADHIPIRYSLFGSGGIFLTQFQEWLGGREDDAAIVADAAGGLRGRAGVARALMSYARVGEPQATFVISSSSPARISAATRDFEAGLPSPTAAAFAAVVHRFRQRNEGDAR